MNKPVYDLIIGVETMAKIGVVMDFVKMEISIDQNTQSMSTLKSLLDSKALNNFHRDHLESTATCEATKSFRAYCNL